MSSVNVEYLTRLEDIARDVGLDGEIAAAIHVVEGGLAVEPEFLDFCKSYLRGDLFYGF